MLLFNNKRLADLEKENMELHRQVLDLTISKSQLELKMLEKFSVVGEFEKDLVEKLELTPLQKSRLDLLLSIESCRLIGVDEKNIIQFDDVSRFVSKKESTEES